MGVMGGYYAKVYGQSEAFFQQDEHENITNPSGLLKGFYNVTIRA